MIFEVRIYLEDVDAMGCVYHANYLKFCERARTQMMESYGFYHADAIRKGQNFFVMRRTEMDYLAPAYLKDTLQIKTTIIRVTGVSVTFHQEISCGKKAVGRLTAQMVYVDSTFKIARMGEELKRVFEKITKKN